MNQTVRFFIAVLLVLSGAPALAMYRCGNVFQDTPCAGGTEIRLSPAGRQLPAGTSSPPNAPAPTAAGSAFATSPFATACARAGDQAQRMVWKREGGASQEQQLADPPGVLSRSEQAKLLGDVYARRGTAMEVRNAIQAECLVEKQKESEATELLGRLRKQSGESDASSASLAASAASAPATRAGAAAPPQAGASAAENAANRSASAGGKPSAAACAGLRKSVDDVNARLRQGGSGQAMERLQNDRRSAENSLRSSGCA